MGGLLNLVVVPLSSFCFLVANFRERCIRDTVDGSEIRRSPVEVGSLYHYSQDIHPMWLGMGFLNHQRYISLDRCCNID